MVERERSGGRGDLHRRPVGRGMTADDGGLEFSIVGETHFDGLRVLHDMVVGEDVTLSVHDDARSHRTGVLPGLPPVEETLEELGAEELPETLLPLRSLAFRSDPLGLDTD